MSAQMKTRSLIESAHNFGCLEEKPRRHGATLDLSRVTSCASAALIAEVREHTSGVIEAFNRSGSNSTGSTRLLQPICECPNSPKGSQPNPKEVGGVLHEGSRIRRRRNA
jgi:hypothetical protein